MSNFSQMLKTNLPRLITLAVVLLMGGTGCGAQSAPNPNQTGPPLPEASNVTPTAAAVLPTATPTPAATPQPETITLTLWTVKDISVMADDEEVSNFLANAVQTFEINNPQIKVDVLVKKSSGKGGVLDFLRTSKEVAPSVVPDVVVMNAKDLDQAYADGLLQTLDNRLARPIVQDLLPAARRVGTVDGNLVGVPLGIEMEHAVYNTAMFSQAPITWTAVLSKNTSYLFPAKGVNGLVNDATLAQYFSAGGQLLNEEERPRLDERVLGSVLKFYQQARETGAISDDLLEASTTEELWPTYLAGRAGVSQLSVSQYLTDRQMLKSSFVTGLPVQNETSPQINVMHAWVLALVTENPERQALALNLMEFLLSTENNTTWNQIKKSIPVRDTAYQQLAGDDPYWQFLTGLLNNAAPEPRFANYDRIGRILQQAVEQVISGEATAEEATNTAIDALGQ